MIGSSPDRKEIRNEPSPMVIWQRNLSTVLRVVEISCFDPSNAGREGRGQSSAVPRTPVELFIELPRQEDDTAVRFSGRCTKLSPNKWKEQDRPTCLFAELVVRKNVPFKGTAHTVQRCFVRMAKRKCWRRMLSAVDDVDEGNRSLKKEERNIEK